MAANKVTMWKRKVFASFLAAVVSGAAFYLRVWQPPLLGDLTFLAIILGSTGIASSYRSGSSAPRLAQFRSSLSERELRQLVRLERRSYGVMFLLAGAVVSALAAFFAHDLLEGGLYSAIITVSAGMFVASMLLGIPIRMEELRIHRRFLEG